MEYQRRGDTQVGLKGRGDGPLADLPGGEDHRPRNHLAVAPTGRRLVVHAELAGARVLAHAGGGAGEPLVGQLLLERRAKVTEERIRW